jgi:hypothetical protein
MFSNMLLGRASESFSSVVKRNILFRRRRSSAASAEVMRLCWRMALEVTVSTRKNVMHHGTSSERCVKTRPGTCGEVRIYTTKWPSLQQVWRHVLDLEQGVLGELVGYGSRILHDWVSDSS